MGTFERIVAWLGKLLATAIGGPAIVVLGDPGVGPVPRRKRRWTFRIVLLGLWLVLVLMGIRWELLIVAALLLVGYAVVDELQVRRRFG